MSPSATVTCHHPWTPSKPQPGTSGDTLVMDLMSPLLLAMSPRPPAAPGAPQPRFPGSAAAIAVPLSQDLPWSSLMQTLARVVNGERHKGKNVRGKRAKKSE